MLFVCVKNGGKSQMAAGLMRKIAGDTVGRALGRHQTAQRRWNALFRVDARTKRAFDISGETTELIDPQLVQEVDIVVTLGREAHVEPVPGTRFETGTPTNPPSAASTGSKG